MQIYIIIGKRKHHFEDTNFEDTSLEKVEKEKVLEFVFNSQGNNEAHIERKTKEGMKMIASLGLTVENSMLYNISIVSLIILYKTCIVPKMIYGMKTCMLTKGDEEE